MGGIYRLSAYYTGAPVSVLITVPVAVYMVMLFTGMLCCPVAVPVGAHYAYAMITARISAVCKTAVLAENAVTAKVAAIKAGITARLTYDRAVFTETAIVAQFCTFTAVIAPVHADFGTVLTGTTVIAKHAAISAGLTT